MRTTIRVSSCVHEPKVVIKTFSLDSDKVRYALCKDCTILKPFNEFLIKEEPFETSKILDVGRSESSVNEN